MKPGVKTRNIKTAAWLLALILILASILWIGISSFHPPLETKNDMAMWGANFLLFTFLSFSIGRLFNHIYQSKRINYRLAFFITLAIGSIQATPLYINHPTFGALSTLLLSAAGGFLGSFIAANITLGWAENNAPPSPEIKKQVFDLHQLHMGPNVRMPACKRLCDIVCALLSLMLSIPVWIIVSVLIWWEDPGPILFVKNSVGHNGINFKQLKFRSMVINAEKDTGPISGYENDERRLSFGKILRKSALDEVPQLVNILLGDMSYVGPRPQRTVLVHEYLETLPQFALRHTVRPGLAGLAQVVDTYDISPQEKLAWDLLYIQNISLRLDLRLVCAAFYLVFGLRWRSHPKPEMVIRHWLNFTKPES